MRQASFIVLVLVGFFLTLISSIFNPVTFLYQVLSLALSTVFSFNSMFYTANIAKPFESVTAANPSAVGISFLAPSSSRNIAQFGFPSIPIPNYIPGGSVQRVIQGAVADQILKALGETIYSEAPIVSSAKDVFPTVDSLPGSPFNPLGDLQQVFQQIGTSPNGTVMLQPGDYAIPVNLFCMKSIAHSPSGHKYLLAPLRGKLADVIVALNSRSVGSGIPHGQLQILSWNLQAGMKYEEMDASIQAIVDKLLPDFKPRLSRSFYEQIQSTWQHLANTIPGLPSLDSALNHLGETGKTVLTLKQTREALIEHGNDFESLSTILVSSSPAASTSDSVNTPWSKISDHIYGRMVTEGNFVSLGTLQLRVMPSSISSDSNRGVIVASTRLGFHSKAETDSPLALESIVATITSLVADPQDPAIQPLSMSPEEQMPTDVIQLPDKWGIKPVPSPEKKFKDCNDFVDYLKSQLEVAKTVPALEIGKNTFNFSTNKDGSIEAVVDVKWSIDPKKSTITLPQLTWPNMTGAEKEALKDAMDALRVHEEGHIQVAEDFAKSISGPVSATGRTSKEAARNLEAKIKNSFEDIKAKLDERGDEYDLATDHGRKQSEGPAKGFPGGKNVLFACPPRVS
ncbi:MAG: DUF922 domain-containing protein [Chroococcidiopsidaceae cyanobacterium CP_BM_RX_35]|nr:DUF922 domain-containing protein [Chroococcidiopsidaceae cyanobacterium CP_BM_RX_35]